MYLAEVLAAMPTLSSGHTDNLKVETEDTRVWLCRCGLADGMCCENHITIERLADGCWRTVEEHCQD